MDTFPKVSGVRRVKKLKILKTKKKMDFFMSKSLIPPISTYEDHHDGNSNKIGIDPFFFFFFEVMFRLKIAINKQEVVVDQGLVQRKKKSAS